MPPQGVDWIPHTDILSFEEILRVVRVLAGLGITKIKVTGGEALTRRTVVDLIRDLKQIPGIQTVTLTSNGVLLAQHLESLIGAGLDALNISLDTLNAETFSRISPTHGFEQLVSVLDKIGELPFPVKINCVPIRSFNDNEITAIAELARNTVSAVRFIELMPLGCAGNFQMLSQEEVMAEIEKVYGPLVPFSGSLGNGPAVYYSLKGFSGKIGFISPMSHLFCNTCNRLRLSAAGSLISCLSGTSGLNMRTLLRSNRSDNNQKTPACLTDDELITLIQSFIQEKPKCHVFANVEQYDKEMFRIGG